jgi:hypothetical protein
MTAQLGDILPKSDARKARGQTRTERKAGTSLLFHSVAENLANLLFRASTMPPGTALETSLHIIVQLTHNQLTHGTYDITISARAFGMWNAASWRASQLDCGTQQVSTSRMDSH